MFIFTGLGALERDINLVLPCCSNLIKVGFKKYNFNLILKSWNVLIFKFSKMGFYFRVRNNMKNVNKDKRDTFLDIACMFVLLQFYTTVQGWIIICRALHPPRT